MGVIRELAEQAIEESDKKSLEADIRESLEWIKTLKNEDKPEGWTNNLPEYETKEETTNTTLNITSSAATIAEELKIKDINKTSKQKQIKFYFKDIRLLDHDKMLDALEKERRLERQRLALKRWEVRKKQAREAKNSPSSLGRLKHTPMDQEHAPMLPEHAPMEPKHAPTDHKMNISPSIQPGGVESPQRLSNGLSASADLKIPVDLNTPFGQSLCSAGHTALKIASESKHLPPPTPALQKAVLEKEPEPSPTQPNQTIAQTSPPPNHQASTEEQHPIVAKMFGKLALPGVQLLNRANLLKTPSLMSTTATTRTTSLLLPTTRPTMTAPGIVLRERSPILLPPTSADTLARNTSLRTDAVVQAATNQIEREGLGARTKTTCKNKTTVKVKVKKWTKKKDGTFGWTMVSATPPRKRTGLALGPPTTQRGGEGGRGGVGSLVNGEKFSFWKKKESLDSTLQLERSDRIEKDETI